MVDRVVDRAYVEAMKIKARITNQGKIGGFIAEVEENGKWRRVNKYVGAGLVSFDSREQAVKAIKAEGRRMLAPTKAA